MSIAGRHGKLSPLSSGLMTDEGKWQRVEDLLTADVFGAYRYLPPGLGIVPFLRRAVDEKGQGLPEWLLSSHVDVDTLSTLQVVLWPSFASCAQEPDALLLLGTCHGTPAVAVLVEAKLRSPLHTIANMSQLGFYAVRHLERDYDEPDLEIPHVLPVLYVTNHMDLPRADLAKARSEIPAPLRDEAGLFWVNWQSALQEAQRVWDEHQESTGSSPWLLLLQDMAEDLMQRGIVLPRAFTGFGQLMHMTLPEPPDLRDVAHCFRASSGRAAQCGRGLADVACVGLERIDSAFWRSLW